MSIHPPGVTIGSRIAGPGWGEQFHTRQNFDFSQKVLENTSKYGDHSFLRFLGSKKEGQILH